MSQWGDLLENLGIWEGSFTHFSADGDQIDDVNSRVSLEGLENNSKICQIVQMLSADKTSVLSERVLNYGSLNRSTLVFETGAFSQGSMQYGPFSEFGAELGFIEGDRRLRLVQLFDQQSVFSKITLIRECRQEKFHEAIHRLNVQPLLLDTLVGTWKGKATTLFSDLSPALDSDTCDVVHRQGDRLIYDSCTGLAKVLGSQIEHHQLTNDWAVERTSVRSTRLICDKGPYSRQMLLLPGGALSITPTSIPRRQSFSLEAVWFSSPDQRQRMIRSYNQAGGWTSLTLAIEHKVKS